MKNSTGGREDTAESIQHIAKPKDEIEKKREDKPGGPVQEAQHLLTRSREKNTRQRKKKERIQDNFPELKERVSRLEATCFSDG